MRLLGSKISDIANKENPIKLLNGLEGYRKNGFWYYRNSNSNAGEFARIWMRVTDVPFQDKLDKFSIRYRFEEIQKKERMIEKIIRTFKGKPWDIAVDCHNCLLESLSIEKEYNVILEIEEL